MANINSIGRAIVAIGRIVVSVNTIKKSTSELLDLFNITSDEILDAFVEVWPLVSGH